MIFPIDCQGLGCFKSSAVVPVFIFRCLVFSVVVVSVPPNADQRQETLAAASRDEAEECNRPLR